MKQTEWNSVFTELEPRSLAFQVSALPLSNPIDIQPDPVVKSSSSAYDGISSWTTLTDAGITGN